jgi:phage terminase large subunit
MLCHRRAGKTVATVNDLLARALQTPGRYAYIAPYHVQAKDIAWQYVKKYASPAVAVGGKVNEGELSVALPNGSTIRLYGAENGERLRGIGLHGVVMDEYADFPPHLWGEVILPTLADHQGWATFIGTPKGRQNDFYRVSLKAKAADWFCAEMRADQTGILAADELALQRSQMTTDQYAQEYLCSFDAAIKGAIYADELAKAREQGRVTRIPLDPSLPVHTWWDLGVGDATAIGFVQITPGGEVRAVDYYEASGEGLPHYVAVLHRKGYVYGKHIAPHDIAG